MQPPKAGTQFNDRGLKYMGVATIERWEHVHSGVTIGRARLAVHAGPVLWGAQNLPDAVF